MRQNSYYSEIPRLLDLRSGNRDLEIPPPAWHGAVPVAVAGIRLGSTWLGVAALSAAPQLRRTLAVAESWAELRCSPRFLR